MNRLSRIAAFALAAGLGIASVPFASPAIAQASSTASRDATREQLRGALASGGARSDVNVSFSQSTKNPYNFVGTMKTGLANSDLLEIVISVTKSDTIGFRIYPHYKGGYINLNKAKDASALMTRLLYLNDQNFLFWGADDTKDVFTAFTFTLESGFPSEALLTVLRSIRNTDKFVGELRPMIDGSAPGG
jgi:hypothetical protein